MFKMLVDKSALNLQCKGGSVGSRLRVLLLCSNTNPLEWWGGKASRDMSLNRRICNRYELRSISEHEYRIIIAGYFQGLYISRI